MTAPAGGGLRRLANASVIYGVGSVLSRGLTFLLLPLYTRHLTAADYGIVAVATTVSAVLSVIFPLGLQGAVARLYFTTDSESHRRAINGTLWIGSIVFAGIMTLLLDRLGAPLFQALLPAIRFDPYIRLSIWTAFLTILGLVPLNVLQIQERPRTYVALSFSASLLTTGGIVALVVFRGQGAYGYLSGALAGSLIAAVPYLIVGFRSVTSVVRRDILRAAMIYSVPLVPHALAGWVLELSDRAILSRFVSLGDVGVYAVGYQLGSAIGIIVSAFTSAWIPVLFRELAKESPAADRELARLATYFLVAFLFAAVGWALLSPQVVGWMLAARFAESYRITQIVIAAYVLNALYVIPVGLLFWKKSTWLIPLVTLGGGVTNVALNLWLVPGVGPMAAAWNTLAGYGVMLLLAWFIARRAYPFPYEYGKLFRAIALAVALFALGSALTPALTPVSFAVRVAVWLAFPFGLMAVGVVEPARARRLLHAIGLER